MNVGQVEALSSLAFFGGGTGGHLFPGIALAERARERFPGLRAVFFRTSRAVEERIFAGRGLETHSLPLSVPAGVRGWLRYALGAPGVEREIRERLARGCDAAFGLGGYASLPGILAARSLGIPVILLEQNVAMGRVNRLLAPFVDAVASSLPGTEGRWGSRLELLGNPLRREVGEAAAGRLHRDRRAEKVLLVVGGSQGAHGLNNAVRGVLPFLGELREKIYWIHVTGDADKDAMAEAYRKNGAPAEVHAYVADLPRLLAQADLVLSRAGGTTLSELAVLGVPSVLVPYPHHKDQHQRLNAEAFVRAGGAVLVEERELNPERLRRVLQEVLFAPERLTAMESGARSLGRPNAADAILDLALELKNRCPPASAFSS